MSNKFATILLIFFIFFFSVDHLLGQNKPDDISQIKYLYEELRFEDAINFGRQILKGAEKISSENLQYIHQYMAFSFYNVGLLDSARVHFLSLLSINPNMELNPVNTSPKIIDFFKQIKADLKEIENDPFIISYPSYVFIEDKRPGAAWRSAILPGWGQYYKEQFTRAYIFGGAFLMSAAVLGVSLVNESNTKDAYLNSTDPDDILNKYDTYNNWSKVRSEERL